MGGKERIKDKGLLKDLVEPITLGIDPSLTAFAMTALGSVSGTFVTWTYTSDQRGVDRLRDIDKWLESRIWHLLRGGGTITDIAMESGVVRSPAAFVLGELSGVVRTRLLQMPVQAGRYPLLVPPTSLKKYVTGKGNVGKNVMLMSVARKWDIEFTDDNAADSYGLAHLVSKAPSLQYEKEVLDKLLADPGKFRGTRTL